MKNLKNIFIIVVCVLAISAFESCHKEIFVADSEIAGIGLDDWSTETHTSLATPNYAQVFD